MGYRLSKIYTRTGDHGTTGLADGSRVDKDDARIEALGAVDELNSVIGMLLSLMPLTRHGDGDASDAIDASRSSTTTHNVEHKNNTARVESTVRDILTTVQHDLFDLGSELAVPDSVRIAAHQVEALETTLDSLNANLAPLKEFILPGGGFTAALAHLARTICRRAERRLCRCAKVCELNPVSARYLNRLSDVLFVIARALNQSRGHHDVLWHNRPPP